MPLCAGGMRGAGVCSWQGGRELRRVRRVRMREDDCVRPGGAADARDTRSHTSRKTLVTLRGRGCSPGELVVARAPADEAARGDVRGDGCDPRFLVGGDAVLQGRTAVRPGRTAVRPYPGDQKKRVTPGRRPATLPHTALSPRSAGPSVSPQEDRPRAAKLLHVESVLGTMEKI